MHTLFALEDIYGLTISETDGEVCLKVNKDKSKDAAELLKMLSAWKEQADKLSAEEISKEDYNQWRYNYPKFENSQHWAKIPSKELSDSLAETFKGKFKTDWQARQNALSYEFLPTAKGVSNMDLFQPSKPLANHSPTNKPLDSKNNRTQTTVINLLSKDLSKVRKPA